MHQVDGVAGRDVEPALAGFPVHLPDRHHALDVRQRERPHQQRVRQAQDRRGRSDAEGKDEQRRHRECRRLDEHADPVRGVTHRIGVEGELTPQPDGIGQRAKSAADEIHVPAPR